MKPRWVIILIILLVGQAVHGVFPDSASTEPVPCPPHPDWKHRLDEADRAEDQVSLLQQIIVSCPGDLRLTEALGAIFTRQNRPEAAANAYRAGLRQIPELLQVLLRAAEAEVATRNYPTAVLLYEVAHWIDPAEPAARNTIEALRKFFPVSDLRFNVRSRENLEVFFEGRHAEAKLNRHPDDPDAKQAYAKFLVAQAEILLQNKKADAAEKLIRRAITVAPHYRPALVALTERIFAKGDIQHKRENYAKALEHYQDALRRLPDSIAAQVRIARTLLLLPGKQNDSLEAYRRARELLKSHPQQGTPDKRTQWALDIENGFTQVDHQNPVFRRREAAREVSNAERATARGRLRETVDAYYRALEWTPQDPVIHQSLADTLRYLETEWQRSIHHYRKAIEHYKENPPPGMGAENLRKRIHHSETQLALLEKNHSGTLAYIQSKLLLTWEKRSIEGLLFIMVFGSVLIFLWRSSNQNGGNS